MRRRTDEGPARAAAPRGLLVRAALLFPVVCLALRLLPFPRTLALVRRLARRKAGADAPAWPLSAAAWAVERAGRLYPLAKCLPQALVAHVLLRNAGHESRVIVGVARDRTDPAAGARDVVASPLLAHAWVECGGIPVVGLAAGRSYALLAPLDV